jgi:hypothetical protein
MYVIEYNGHPVAGGFGKSHIPGYNARKYLRSEEAPQIGGDLFGKSCSVVVHRKKDTFDGQ